jgi:hypothetical protein
MGSRITLSTWLQFPGIAISVAALLAALFPVRAEEHNVFGEKTASEAALMGIFYDLKQTQDGKPSNVDVNEYWRILDEFFSKGWDESVLNRYYRITRPLYTTQVYIPNINADSAPKAFGAGRNIKPSRWVIHYKGQVSPPENGTYRFCGAADDVIAAAVDGRTVLLKPLHAPVDRTFPKTGWRRDKDGPEEGIRASTSRLYNGNWIEMKADQVYDLDVLIGERPGGQFYAFLMIEKKGGSYETDKDGPVLPIFQIAPYDTPVPTQDRAPRFAKDAPIWKSYQ